MCTPEKSEEVDYDEKIFIREHYRQKAQRVCKCPNEKVPRFVIAEAPKKLIPGGKYSTRFWRFIMEEKFLLQRPISRVVTKLRFGGLKKISAGVITNGLRLIYETRIFEVMYLCIIDRSRIAGQWNMDDTGWKVFSESSSHWHMWVSRSVDTCVYVLDPERSNRVVARLLKGVTQGIICADRHSSFKAFVRRNEGFIIAFCWAHQRRDFLDMITGYPDLAEWCQSWLGRINALFHQNKVRVSQIDNPNQFKVEDEILRKMITGMEKESSRQLKRKTLHTEQRARLTSLQEHWSGLTVFVDHPLVPMDNNLAEQALRNLVVGRKIYYGSRAVWSGDMLAQLATIYATLELNNVDCRQWMDDYTKACAANGGDPPKDLHQFLPWNYKATSTPIKSIQEPDSALITVSVLPQQPLQAVSSTTFGHT
jgi:transposase